MCETLNLRKQGSNGLQNTSCDVGMHFGKVRDYTVKIRNDKQVCMPSVNVACIPLAVVIMSIFPEGIRSVLYFPIVSDLYRLITEIAEVH